VVVAQVVFWARWNRVILGKRPEGNKKQPSSVRES